MKEVWPKEENFGAVHFRMIKEFLQGMLNSRTSKEWDDSYESARCLLRHCPIRKEKLDSIYLDPVYYSGYYVKGINCNLNAFCTTQTLFTPSNCESNYGHLLSCNCILSVELIPWSMQCERVISGYRCRYYVSRSFIMVITISVHHFYSVSLNLHERKRDQ